MFLYQQLGPTITPHIPHPMTDLADLPTTPWAFTDHLPWLAPTPLWFRLTAPAACVYPNPPALNDHTVMPPWLILSARHPLGSLTSLH